MSKILIVDDEPSIVDNITFALETEGLSTISCTTGGDALITKKPKGSPISQPVSIADTIFCPCISIGVKDAKVKTRYTF